MCGLSTSATACSGLTNGTYAEQVVGPEASWARLPAGLEVHNAAAIPLVTLTGAQLVEEAVNVQKGATLLVTGAIGSVGRVAVFVAKKRGARVWAGVRTTQKAEAMKLGVEGVVAIDDEAEIAKLPQLDAIADTVGAVTIAKLSRKGEAGRDDRERGGRAGRREGTRANGAADFSRIPMGRSLGNFAESAAHGDLVIPISARFPLAQAREAQKLAERGTVGKVLLIVRE